MDNQFEVGDEVRWSDSPYTIIKIEDGKALLKQRFSIKIVLNGLVPLNKLTKD